MFSKSVYKDDALQEGLLPRPQGRIAGGKAAFAAASAAKARRMVLAMLLLFALLLATFVSLCIVLALSDSRKENHKGKDGVLKTPGRDKSDAKIASMDGFDAFLRRPENKINQNINSNTNSETEVDADASTGNSDTKITPAPPNGLSHESDFRGICPPGYGYRNLLEGWDSPYRQSSTMWWVMSNNGVDDARLLATHALPRRGVPPPPRPYIALSGSRISPSAQLSAPRYVLELRVRNGSWERLIHSRLQLEPGGSHYFGYALRLPPRPARTRIQVRDSSGALLYRGDMRRAEQQLPGWYFGGSQLHFNGRETAAAFDVMVDVPEDAPSASLYVAHLTLCTRRPDTPQLFDKCKETEDVWEDDPDFGAGWNRDSSEWRREGQAAIIGNVDANYSAPAGMHSVILSRAGIGHSTRALIARRVYTYKNTLAKIEIQGQVRCLNEALTDRGYRFKAIQLPISVEVDGKAVKVRGSCIGEEPFAWTEFSVLVSPPSRSDYVDVAFSIAPGFAVAQVTNLRAVVKKCKSPLGSLLAAEAGDL